MERDDEVARLLSQIAQWQESGDGRADLGTTLLREKRMAEAAGRLQGLNLALESKGPEDRAETATTPQMHRRDPAWQSKESMDAHEQQRAASRRDLADLEVEEDDDEDALDYEEEAGDDEEEDASPSGDDAEDDEGVADILREGGVANHGGLTTAQHHLLTLYSDNLTEREDREGREAGGSSERPAHDTASAAAETNAGSREPVVETIDTDVRGLHAVLWSSCEDLIQRATDHASQVKLRLLKENDECLRRRDEYYTAKLQQQQQMIQQLEDRLATTEQERDMWANKADVLISRLAETHERLVSTIRNTKVAGRAWGTWQRGVERRRKNRIIYQMAENHRERRRKIKAWKDWSMEVQRMRHTQEKRDAEAHLEAVSKQIIDRYELELGETREALRAATQQIAEEQRHRADLEENMRQALLRGMSAMSVEALSLFNGQPVAGAEGDASAESAVPTADPAAAAAVDPPASTGIIGGSATPPRPPPQGTTFGQDSYTSPARTLSPGGGQSIQSSPAISISDSVQSNQGEFSTRPTAVRGAVQAVYVHKETRPAAQRHPVTTAKNVKVARHVAAAPSASNSAGGNSSAGKSSHQSRNTSTISVAALSAGAGGQRSRRAAAGGGRGPGTADPPESQPRVVVTRHGRAAEAAKQQREQQEIARSHMDARLELQQLEQQQTTQERERAATATAVRRTRARRGRDGTASADTDGERPRAGKPPLPTSM